jgi:hypothetical protein
LSGAPVTATPAAIAIAKLVATAVGIVPKIQPPWCWGWWWVGILSRRWGNVAGELTFHVFGYWCTAHTDIPRLIFDSLICSRFVSRFVLDLFSAFFSISS